MARRMVPAFHRSIADHHQHARAQLNVCTGLVVLAQPWRENTGKEENQYRILSGTGVQSGNRSLSASNSLWDDELSIPPKARANREAATCMADAMPPRTIASPTRQAGEISMQ